MPSRPTPLVVESERVPTYAFPENAVRALAKVAAYAEWRARPAGLLWSFDDIRAEDARAVCQTALRERGDGWLTSEEAHAVLGAFALPQAPGMIAHSADDAAALAHVVGFPVAAKLAARRVPHKTDAGVVVLNLSSDEQVRRAYTDIVARAKALTADDEIEGVLIQPMISGVETMIGVTTIRCSARSSRSAWAASTSRFWATSRFASRRSPTATPTSCCAASAGCRC
jgi:acetyltransferase